jgi:dihydropteroate synthase
MLMAYAGSRKPGAITLIMGIINVTPDSFSDGGCYMSPAARP